MKSKPAHHKPTHSHDLHDSISGDQTLYLVLLNIKYMLGLSKDYLDLGPMCGEHPYHFYSLQETSCLITLWQSILTQHLK